jgi:hypothetical protein
MASSETGTMKTRSHYRPKERYLEALFPVNSSDPEQVARLNFQSTCQHDNISLDSVSTRAYYTSDGNITYAFIRISFERATGTL